MPYLSALQESLRHSYVVDYSAFFREYKQLLYFENKQKGYWFIKTWIKVLKEHDDFEGIAKGASTYKEFDKKPFAQEVLYQYNKLYIHFNISTIKPILEEKSALYELKDIRVDEFYGYGDSVHIYRTDVDWLDTSYPRNYNPVYIVPFITPAHVPMQIDSLLIDGNHRVAMAHHKREKYIPAYLISEKLLAESQIHSTSFDKMFYIFYNEYALFSHLKKEGKSDNELLSQSFLLKLGYEFV